MILQAIIDFAMGAYASKSMDEVRLIVCVAIIAVSSSNPLSASVIMFCSIIYLKRRIFDAIELLQFV